MRIRARALCWAVGWSECHEIDALNILEATHLAMRRALLGLPCARAAFWWMAIGCRCLADSAAGARRAPSSGATAASRRSARPRFSPKPIVTRRHAPPGRRLSRVWSGGAQGLWDSGSSGGVVRHAACAIHRRSFGPVSRTPRIVPVESSSMKTQFVHLRLHTEFSLVDSIVRVPELLAATAAAGMPAVASPIRTTCSRW